MKRTRIKLLALAATFVCSSYASAQGDSCSSAVPISGTGGFAANLSGLTPSNFPNACGLATAADGFFQWTAPAAGSYRFQLNSNWRDNTLVQAYLGTGCNATCIGTSQPPVTWLITGTGLRLASLDAGDQILLRMVRGVGLGSDSGSLTVSTYTDFCGNMPDDGFEENDTCSSASPIQNGTYLDLKTIPTDWDHYALCVDPGDVLSVSGGNSVFLALWDASHVNCGDYNGLGALVSGAGGVSWTNSTGTNTNLVLAVRPLSPSCTLYNLTVSGAATCAGGNPLTPFCDPMDNNSTGLPTVLTGTQSGGLHLEVSQGPPTQFGYFLVGSTVSEPGTTISQGRLCLDQAGGSLLGRYNIAGGVLNSLGQFDGAGVLQNQSGTSSVGTGFDVPNALPFTGSPLIVVGETWNFQLWHREDMGQSNFSNGLSVTF